MKTRIILFIVFICSLAGVKTALLFSQENTRKYLWLDIYADSNKTTSFDYHLPAGEVRFNKQEDKTSFGLSCSNQYFTRNYPVTFRFGNLSSGGSISLLNNPLLSAASSPFSAGTFEVKSITAALPGSTSFSKPESSFFQLTSTSRKNTVSEIQLNTIYTPEQDTLALSSLLKLSWPKKKIKLGTSLTAGYFSYDENNVPSWFSNEKYYHEGNHFCSMYQFSLGLNHFSSILTTGIYETPFGTYSQMYRLENKLNTNHFIFNFAGAYNPNNLTETLVTSSGKQLEDCFQFRGGLQYKFTAGTKLPLFVKTGVQNYICYNLSKTEHPAKVNLGLQVTNPVFSISFTLNANLLLDSSNPNYVSSSFDSSGFQIKNTFYTDNFIPSFLCSFNFNPSADYSSTTITSKFGFSCSYTKVHKLSSSCTLSLTNKDNQYTGKKITASVYSKILLKHTNIILKISADNAL